MSGEVISFEKFFEVVRQSNGIKLDDVSIKALYSTWMNISVNETHLMHVPDSFCDLPQDLESLFWLKLLLAKCFPRGQVLGDLHFD